VKECNSVRVLSARLAGPALMAAVLAAPCQVAAAATEPARWRPYDLIIDLRDLPKSYSCDDLYYKFWGVMSSLGAGSNMRILSYQCERGRGAPGGDMPARSPRVQLHFELPEALPAGDARLADLEAVERTIRLEPASRSGC
jgi:hypothetical protein